MQRCKAELRKNKPPWKKSRWYCERNAAAFKNKQGQKEMTDINAFADEYLRLAYHGLRAKEKSFNAKFETDFDNSVGRINIFPRILVV
jgi:hypothetical protein